MDKIKLGFAFLLMAAGIGGFYYLRDSAMVVRVISVLAGFILAGESHGSPLKASSFMHSVGNHQKKPRR